MYKKLKDLRKSKKGFTLVELIVVLVILAILAAILVPTLLGYIEKAKQKQVTTDASACLTAVQSLADEAYGAYNGTDTKTSAISATKVKDLTQITTSFSFSVTSWFGSDSAAKSYYQVKGFTFTENGYTATWSNTDGSWKVAKKS